MTNKKLWHFDPQHHAKIQNFAMIFFLIYPFIGLFQMTRQKEEEWKGEREWYVILVWIGAQKHKKSLRPWFTLPSHPTLHVLSKKREKKGIGMPSTFFLTGGLGTTRTKLQWAESRVILFSLDQVMPSPIKNQQTEPQVQFGTHWTRRFQSILQSSIIEHTCDQKKKR